MEQHRQYLITGRPHPAPPLPRPADLVPAARVDGAVG